MCFVELYNAIQAQADARNEEVLAAVVLSTSPELLRLDAVGIELACEVAMASGWRKKRLLRLLHEHFSERFGCEDRYGFERIE